MRILGILTVFFVVGFLALHLVHRATLKERNRRKTYDEQRLALRLEIAEAWYADKFGPEALRLQQRRAQIEPYGDLETYELRGLYRVQRSRLMPLSPGRPGAHRRHEAARAAPQEQAARRRRDPLRGAALPDGVDRREWAWWAPPPGPGSSSP